MLCGPKSSPRGWLASFAQVDLCAMQVVGTVFKTQLHSFFWSFILQLVVRIIEKHVGWFMEQVWVVVSIPAHTEDLVSPDFYFYLFIFFRAAPVACWSSQAKHQTGALASPDPGHVCNLCCSSQELQILNPLSGVKDWTRICILMDTNWVCNSLSHNGNSSFFFPPKDHQTVDEIQQWSIFWVL